MDLMESKNMNKEIHLLYFFLIHDRLIGMKSLSKNIAVLKTSIAFTFDHS